MKTDEIKLNITELRREEKVIFWIPKSQLDLKATAYYETYRECEDHFEFAIYNDSTARYPELKATVTFYDGRIVNFCGDNRFVEARDAIYAAFADYCNANVVGFAEQAAAEKAQAEKLAAEKAARKAEFMKKVAVENAQAAAEAELLDLPALSGSEKQIAWANSIRAAAMKKLSEKEISTKIKTCTTAKWWINHRKEFGM